MIRTFEISNAASDLIFPQGISEMLMEVNPLIQRVRYEWTERPSKIVKDGKTKVLLITIDTEPL